MYMQASGWSVVMKMKMMVKMAVAVAVVVPLVSSPCMYVPLRAGLRRGGDFSGCMHTC